jgi:glyceraldehyde 3-phosphate dehydrogenase
MPINVGINGFGRIGRGVVRALLKRGEPGINLVAVNDLLPASQNAHLLKYDSVHGVLPNVVKAESDGLSVDGRKIRIFAEKDPSNIPWKSVGVDIVLECTGFFTDREKAELHLKGGAKKVLISAPAKNEDITVAIGINHDKYDPAKHNIVSNASCTTNCLAPVAKVLHENFRIKRGLMTTIHSYTNDQRTLDVGHSDLRRARAAAMSQIPTTTGAAKAIGLVIPELKGKLDGLSIRVPTPNVSCVDLVCEVEQATDKDAVNSVLKQAAEGALRGILAFTTEPLVSVDFNGNPHSSTVDGLCTSVMDKTMVKVLAWYDNETGFSNRLLELTKYVGERL